MRESRGQIQDQAGKIEEQSIRSIGRELLNDFQNLFQQHVSIVKTEGGLSMSQIRGAVFTYALYILMIALALLRLVDATVSSLGQTWDWSMSQRGLAGGLIFLLFGICFGVFSQYLFRRAGQSLGVVVKAMKEDYYWLKKIL